MIRNALDMDAAEVFSLDEDVLTRSDAALALYLAARLAPDSPGMAVIRKQG